MVAHIAAIESFWPDIMIWKLPFPQLQKSGIMKKMKVRRRITHIDLLILRIGSVLPAAENGSQRSATEQRQNTKHAQTALRQNVERRDISGICKSEAALQILF
jgi:hypothetical protein